ncbi:hypothetical protein CspeluHIS016_0403130 [Cutaneotrichosporon spelunceum]|uniref:NECAP PHear domain-containing protein n=1 Tax=Cutaneotrichosporon spelunceum TaxID=1672016 RepID=A0AAD3TV64_9TREE|nr:hypothetical protein CspeluHIS016_0403130 [Cutaneotrichosporon spelunceum]
MDQLTEEIESVSFVAREVMVYQVPPRTSAQGYKAAEWDVEKFLWKGRLRVIEVGTRCDLRLEDPNTGELFAQATYASPWTQVEPVLDSSRYFVLRVEGDGGQRAYIGMGFLERSESFDFQVALQAVAKRASQPTETEDKPKDRAPPKDYSLKEGQTFSIKLPGRDKPAAPKPAASEGSGLFSLPPPPPPGRRR